MRKVISKCNTNKVNSAEVMCSYTDDQNDLILDVALDEICQLISCEDLMIAISKWLSDDDFSEFVRANWYDEVYDHLDQAGNNPEDWF